MQGGLHKKRNENSFFLLLLLSTKQSHKILCCCFSLWSKFYFSIMQWDYQENFKRTGLRTSLMFASTPTLNSAGNSSVDETASSTGSNSDYWENSSSNDQNDLVFSTGRRIFLQNPNRLKSTRKKHIRSKRTDSPETSKSRSDLDVKVTQNVIFFPTILHI